MTENLSATCNNFHYIGDKERMFKKKMHITGNAMMYDEIILINYPDICNEFYVIQLTYICLCVGL